LDILNAIERCISPLMKNLKRTSTTVASTLATTFLTNVTTSNQYATSFIVAVSFKSKYDSLKIKRKVLSRSIEDAGTMMENLVPWTPSGIFMASTLGVATADYLPYQVLSLTNILVAFLFAFTGIAIFRTNHVEENLDAKNEADTP